MEEAGKGIILMTVCSKNPRFHIKKIYSSNQPHLLRKDLLTFNSITSGPILIMWKLRPQTIISRPSRLWIIEKAAEAAVWLRVLGSQTPDLVLSPLHGRDMNQEGDGANLGLWANLIFVFYIQMLSPIPPFTLPKLVPKTGSLVMYILFLAFLTLGSVLGTVM